MYGGSRWETLRVHGGANACVGGRDERWCRYKAHMALCGKRPHQSEEKGDHGGASRRLPRAVCASEDAKRSFSLSWCTYTRVCTIIHRAGDPHIPNNRLNN